LHPKSCFQKLRPLNCFQCAFSKNKDLFIASKVFFIGEKVLFWGLIDNKFDPFWSFFTMCIMPLEAFFGIARHFRCKGRHIFNIDLLFL